MEVMEAIQKRRSVRKFSDRSIEEESINKLLTAAIWAPSAGNAQPWRFLVVRNEDLKQGLVQAARGQRFIAQAPITIVVCVDLDRARRSYGDRGISLYCIQDTAAAIQNINLAAVSLGLATCWVGAFDEQSVAKLLGLPNHLRPVALIPVGYPAETPPSPSRRPVSEVAEFR